MNDRELYRDLDRNRLGLLEDWVGNNIALACPVCLKVFIVSGLIHHKGRECPNCGKSKAVVSQDGKSASMECSADLPSWRSDENSSS
jgi:hypothetical protein